MDKVSTRGLMEDVTQAVTISIGNKVKESTLGQMENNTMGTGTTVYKTAKENSQTLRIKNVEEPGKKARELHGLVKSWKERRNNKRW